MLRRAATRTRTPTTPVLRWRVKDEHVKDAAQDVAEDVPQDVAQDLGFGLRGPGGARPHRHATPAAAAVFVHLALRWGRNWAARWHLARAVGGKRFRGCRAKRLYVHTSQYWEVRSRARRTACPPLKPR